MPITATVQRCSKCGEVKPLDGFNNNRSRKNGKHNWCRPCQQTFNRERRNPERDRDYMLRYKYGIGADEWDLMFARQGGSCAICGTTTPPPVGNAKVGVLAVDHDHKSGKVRGLLCHFCNAGLGHFQDNPELLALAVDYLHAHEETD